MIESIMVEIYPKDGPHRFTTSRSTYYNQSAVPRKGDLLYIEQDLYRVEQVCWVYTAKFPLRVVVTVKVAFPIRRPRWRRSNDD